MSFNTLGTIPVQVEFATQETSTEAQNMAISAVLVEVKQALQQFNQTGQRHSIDLTSLPLSEFALAHLLKLLGQGELQITLSALGQSIIYETEFSALWVIKHLDEDKHVTTLLIEVCQIPDIVLSEIDDIDELTRGLDDLIEEIS